MPLNISSPVTGSAQTGFTSPTYTLVSDTAPNSHSKQHFVSALGGTQAGVTTHSVGSPFTFTVERPQYVRTVGSVNPVTGVLSSVPVNFYKIRTRKGVSVISDGSVRRVAMAETILHIPAGSDFVDPAELLAMLSLQIGALQQLSAELGNTVKTGTI